MQLQALNDAARDVKVDDAARWTNAGTNPRQVHIPNSYLGRIFSSGKDVSIAHAIQLLAVWRSYDWDAFVLNEIKEAKPVADGGHAIPRKRFQSGIRRLNASGVNKRVGGGRKPGSKRGAYAKETWAPRTDSYVKIPASLISGNPKLLAFIVDVRRNPFALTAVDVGKKFGVKARDTLRRLVTKATATGLIASIPIPGGFMVARSAEILEPFKKRPVENGPVENGPTHRLQIEEAQPAGRTAQSPERKKQSTLRTQPAAAAGADTDFLVLKDWKTARYFREERTLLFPFQTLRPAVDRETWAQMLDRYGSVPGHLKTIPVHRQAMEIIAELGEVVGAEQWDVMHGLVFEIWQAVKSRRVIHSLGFIAEKLIRKADEGDDTWIFDLPSLQDQTTLDWTMKWAKHYIAIANTNGIETHDRVLLGTIGLEALVRILRRAENFCHTFEKWVTGAAKPGDGNRVCGWTYFKQPAANTGSPSLKQESAKSDWVKAKIEAAQAAKSEPKPKKAKEEREPPIDPNLRILFDADEEQTLAPALLGDARGLQVFLDAHGWAEPLDLLGTPTHAEALEVLVNVLQRHAIRGKARSSVRSWKHFSEAIGSEKKARAEAADNERRQNEEAARLKGLRKAEEERRAVARQAEEEELRRKAAAQHQIRFAALFFSPDDWRKRLRSTRFLGWSIQNYGPAPGEPGCFLPPEVHLENGHEPHETTLAYWAAREAAGDNFADNVRFTERIDELDCRVVLARLNGANPGNSEVY